MTRNSRRLRAMRGLLSITATALLLGAAPADAAPRKGLTTAPVAWQDAATKLVNRTWKCTDGKPLTIQFDRPENQGGHAGWGGWYKGDCIIWMPLNREWLGYPEFCTNALHEGGHAAGLGHSPTGLMAAETMFTVGTSVVDGRRLKAVWTGADRRCLKQSK